MSQDRPEDPFEVFQPWDPPGVEAEAPEPKRQRWAPPPTPAPSPGTDAGKVAPSVPQTPPDPTLQPARFLRDVGIPEVTRILGRLEDQGHRGKIEDRLDLGQPSMRVLLRPKPDLLARPEDRIVAVLELAIESEEGDERVVSYYYIGSREQRTELAQTSLEGLSSEWMVDQVLEFLKLVLERA